MSRDEDNLIWDIATATFSEYVSGFLGVQVDTLGAGASAPTFQAHYPYGFFGRPRDPEPGTAGAPGVGCTSLYCWEGERGHVFPLGDPRLAALMPESPKGSSGMAVLRDDGQYTAVRLGGDDGAFVVILHDAAHGDSYLRLDLTDGFDVNTPWFRFQGGPKGVHIVTTAGARLDLGSIGGIPAPPFDALTSTAKLVGGIASIQGSVVKLGVDGGIANEAGTTALAAAATALAAAATAMQAAFTEIAATPAAIGVPVLTPPTAAALNVAASALAAAATALAPLALAIGKVI